MRCLAFLVFVCSVGAGAAAQPADECADASLIPAGTATGSTIDATNDGDGGCGSADQAADVWFRAVAPADGAMIADTCGSNFDTVLSVHSACPGTSANALACNDDDCGLQSRVVTSVVGGAEYWLRLSGFEDARGEFTLNLTFDQTLIGADDCGAAPVITPGTYFGATNGATPDGAANCAAAASPDLWYRFIPDADGLLTARTCGSAYDTLLSVHTACPATSDNEVACNDDACGIQSAVNALVNANQAYFIRLGGWDGAVGSYQLDVTFRPDVQDMGPDAVLGELNSFGVFGQADGILGCAIDVPLCNAGTEPLDWYANPDPRHPFMTFNMYRIAGGDFRQIGLSWVKHGFAAEQADVCGFGCAPHPDGTRLGVGCSDTYGSTLNANQMFMGPRSEVNPWTGAFTFEGSHLDTSSGAHDSIQHRLQIRESDLDPTAFQDARYLCEVRVICHDDLDPTNNVAWEPVTVTGSPGSTWSFDIGAAATRSQTALDAWTADTRTTFSAEPDDGRCYLAVRTEPLEGGWWRYRYVLQNFDLSLGVSAFTLSVLEAVQVRDAGMFAVRTHGESQFSNQPWNLERFDNTLRWVTRPDSEGRRNPLRWGMTDSFWFDADAPPAQGNARLGLYLPGDISGLAQPVPLPVLRIGDVNRDGCVDNTDLGALLGAYLACDGAPHYAPEADLNSDGCINQLDLGILLANYLTGCGG